MLDKPIAVDIETTGLDWSARLISVAAAKRNGDGEIETTLLNLAYVQTGNLFGFAFGDDAEPNDRIIRPMLLPEARHAFQEFIADGDALVLHNAAFDLPFLVKAGILTRKELDGWDVFDTMVYARCTGAHERVALDALVADYGIEVDPRWLEGKKVRTKLLQQPWDLFELYARMDAHYTLDLAERMIPKAKAIYDDAFIREDGEWCKLVSMLRVDGIQLRREAAIAMREERQKRINELRRELDKHGILGGPNSSEEIRKWAGRMGQAHMLNRTPIKQELQTDETSLRQMTGDALPVVELILECRKLEKQRATWIDGPLEAADQEDRVHPLFTVSGAKSNRLSCRRPNAQAFPKVIIREVMSARPGYKLVAMDLSQAELRVAAAFAREPVLAAEFAKPDADPYMAVAKMIFGPGATTDQRQIAKQVVLLSIYGGGAGVLMDTVNDRLKDRPELHITKQEAADIQKRFRGRLTLMARTLRKAEEIWKQRGYLIALGGKRIYASETDLNVAYKAFDFLVQPSVAELIKRAMLGIKRQLPEVLLVNQVHDDIWMEIPDDQYFDTRVQKARTIMLESWPDEMRDMVTPPIHMKVDVDILSEGLPYPAGD